MKNVFPDMAMKLLLIKEQSRLSLLKISFKVMNSGLLASVRRKRVYKKVSFKQRLYT